MNRQNDALNGRIRKARRAAELSQEALAVRVGVARQTINRWEKDPDAAEMITYRRLRDIATSCGVTFHIPPVDANPADDEQAA